MTRNISKLYASGANLSTVASTFHGWYPCLCSLPMMVTGFRLKDSMGSVARLMLARASSLARRSYAECVSRSISKSEPSVYTRKVEGQTDYIEVKELCAGCHQSHPESDLASIIDGSIKICGTCYPNAKSMFLKEGADDHVPQRISQSAEVPVVAALSRSTRSRLRPWFSSFASFAKLFWN